jgi:hypothetical protein
MISSTMVGLGHITRYRLFDHKTYHYKVGKDLVKDMALDDNKNKMVIQIKFYKGFTVTQKYSQII